MVEGTFIAALADGASSAKLADTGASVAVDAVIECVMRAIVAGEPDGAKILTNAVNQARERVFAVASDQCLAPREFASTLLTVVATPTGVAAAQVGDGVVVVREGESSWRWLFWPQHGEYANTTCFLTDDNALDVVQVRVFDGAVSDIGLTTDGLERLALDQRTECVYEPFFRGLFRPLYEVDGTGDLATLSNSLSGFLRSDRVRERTDDDVSLIIATCRPPNSVNDASEPGEV